VTNIDETRGGGNLQRSHGGMGEHEQQGVVLVSACASSSAQRHTSEAIQAANS